MLDVLPQRREEFLILLDENRRYTQCESGTLEWTIHDVRDQPGAVALYELYDSQAASDEHDQGSPALKELLARLDEFLAVPPSIVTLDATRFRLDP
jgi:quinol monooxygenase YgiN